MIVSESESKQKERKQLKKRRYSKNIEIENQKYLEQLKRHVYLKRTSSVCRCSRMILMCNVHTTYMLCVRSEVYLFIIAIAAVLLESIYYIFKIQCLLRLSALATYMANCFCIYLEQSAHHIALIALIASHEMRII